MSCFAPGCDPKSGFIESRKQYPGASAQGAVFIHHTTSCQWPLGFVAEKVDVSWGL